MLRVVSCRVVRTHPTPIEVATSVKQGVTLPPRPRKSGKKRRRTDKALGITRAKLSMDTLELKKEAEARVVHEQYPT